MKKLCNFDVMYKMEVLVYLEHMVNSVANNRKTVNEWAEKLIYDHNINKNECADFLNDVKSLQNFFDTVYDEIKIEEEILNKYFSILGKSNSIYDNQSIASVLILYFPLVLAELKCSEDKAIYTAICHIFNKDENYETNKFKHIESFDLFLKEIEKAEIDDGVKWKLLQLSKNFELYKTEIDNIIENVWQIYKKNSSMLNSVVEKHTEIIEEIMRNSNEQEWLDNFYMSIGENETSKICYSISFFNGVMLTEYDKPRTDNILCIGLFHNYASKIIEKKPSKENMEMVLKCLGETRKLEIIMSLLKSPCNGKELARRLSLTPATISHHVSTLAQNGIIFLKDANTQNSQYRVNNNLIKTNLQALINILG